MSEIVKAIETKDWRSLRLVAFRLADASNISIHELVEVLEILSSIVVAFPEQSITEHKGEKVSWHRYETLIWQLGETFRQVLKKKKEFRKDPNLFRAIEQNCLDKQFSKGRESFVMLLGQYGDQKVISTLLPLLNDPEVQGHAVYALRLLGAPEAQDSVRPFLHSAKTWVRNEAKKYFQKIAKQKRRA